MTTTCTTATNLLAVPHSAAAPPALPRRPLRALAPPRCWKARLRLWRRRPMIRRPTPTRQRRAAAQRPLTPSTPSTVRSRTPTSTPTPTMPPPTADEPAADAAASRRRTEARLEELEEAQPALSPGHAALQFAARGVELLGNPPTASVESSGALVGPPNPDLGTLGASRDEGSVAPVPVFRGLPARTPRGGALGPSTWTPSNGYGRRPFPARPPATAHGENDERPVRRDS